MLENDILDIGFYKEDNEALSSTVLARFKKIRNWMIPVTVFWGLLFVLIAMYFGSENKTIIHPIEFAFLIVVLLLMLIGIICTVNFSSLLKNTTEEVLKKAMLIYRIYWIVITALTLLYSGFFFYTLVKTLATLNKSPF